MLIRNSLCCLMVASLAMLGSNHTQAAVGESTLTSMPVREVTVFKNGYAFVHHEGKLKTDEKGNVSLDYLPTPVLGTFWSYSANPKVKLTSVTAGKQRVVLKRTALNLLELIKSNVGSKVQLQVQENIHSKGSKLTTYSGKILSIPTRSAKEIAAISPVGSGPHLSVQGSVILLKTDEGTRVVSLNAIRNAIFLDNTKAELQYEEIRTRLRLNLDWKDAKPNKETHIGMTYLQKGLRWIPHYSLTLNDDGTMKVQLQATLINDLTDLDNVKMNLLVGVPHIQFEGYIDPIAMHQQAVRLTAFMQNGNTSLLNNNFSNGIMSQSMSGNTQLFTSPVTNLPDLPTSSKNDEMFVFRLKNISLAKGERMVVPVGEWTVKYEHVYLLNIPITPPVEARYRFNASQQEQLAKQFGSPKVKHVIRIFNSSNAPFTTAPALIKTKKGILGQSKMTYTAVNGSVDLTVTTAVNVPVKHEEEELSRKWYNPESKEDLHGLGNPFSKDARYSRIDLKGEITVTNYNKKPITIEVTRMTMGKVDVAGEKGSISQPAAWAGTANDAPIWRSWYTLPDWWHHLNSQNRIKWKMTLKPGQKTKLSYQWHYFWSVKLPKRR